VFGNPGWVWGGGNSFEIVQIPRPELARVGWWIRAYPGYATDIYNCRPSGDIQQLVSALCQGHGWKKAGLVSHRTIYSGRITHWRNVAARLQAISHAMHAFQVTSFASKNYYATKSTALEIPNSTDIARNILDKQTNYKTVLRYCSELETCMGKTTNGTATGIGRKNCGYGNMWFNCENGPRTMWNSRQWLLFLWKCQSKIAVHDTGPYFTHFYTWIPLESWRIVLNDTYYWQQQCLEF